MQNRFACPICAANNWTTIRTYTYDILDHQPGGRFHNNEYLKLRRQVLFDLWLPQHSYIEITARYCGQCGFVCYAPRPDAVDLFNKYEFLTETEIIVGGQQSASDKALLMDRKRSMRVYREIKKTIPLVNKTVLDVGGGDGKLMLPFLNYQNDCYIVDYNRHPLPKVNRLGDSVEDISDEMQFDVIVCSHVLEHIADPVEFLQKTERLLKPKGKAYFEVPLEIWRGIPIDAEPVTHINFFTKHSLANALHQARFRCIRLRSGIGSYGRYRLHVIRVVAESVSNGGTLGISKNSVDFTRKLVVPGPFQKIRRELFVSVLRERSLRAVFRRVRRIFK